MPTSTIIFDVETGSLAPELVKGLMPQFQAPANYRSPEAIASYIREQQAKWVANAALSPLSGRVLCIGVKTPWDPGYQYFDQEDEKTLLSRWWEEVGNWIRSGHQLAGFCCRRFDIRFLLRRSWRHGLHEPMCVWAGKFISPVIIDIADRWGCGEHSDQDKISLDTLARFLEIGRKNGDGSQFAELLAKDRAAAAIYLQNDLDLTAEAFKRIVGPAL